jgi:hypothetical protein
VYLRGVLDLAKLVAPLPVETFLAEHWPARPYHASEGPDRAATLVADHPELESAEALMRAAKQVNFFKPDGGTGTTTPEGAPMVYRMGLTCFMGCGHIPSLREAAEGLAADLGLPAGSMTCEAFFSDGTSGARMHSDHDVNFAIQVRGRKRWRFAENRHIRNQTALARPPEQPVHDPTQNQLADVQPFPSEMPGDAETIDLADGGMVFLPRGWWHETAAEGECLQINFVFNRPMWLEVLTKALSRRLLADPAWRAYAFDVFAEPERREAALVSLGELVSALADELGAEDPATLAARLVEDAGLAPAASRSGAGPAGR